MKIDRRITGKTKLIGIIGCPVEHSISPQLHNTISSDMGVNLVYVPFRVEKDQLEHAVKGLKAINILGFNVTIPYKKDVMKYLDDNTKEALLMGAVNTVKNIDGRFYGYNTDAEGFSRSFKESMRTGFKGKRVLLVGAGGSARAIAVKTAIEGAERVTILNRTVEKAGDITGIIKNNFDAKTFAYGLEDPKAKNAFADSDIIINTTPVGMIPETGKSPLDDTFRFSRGQMVYDIIYNPPKTKFLEDAENSGCNISNGLGMLFYQGINAYEIWTGIKLPEEKIRALFASFLDILKN